MSKSPSGHRISSRHCEIVNSGFSSAVKTPHRNSQEDTYHGQFQSSELGKRRRSSHRSSKDSGNTSNRSKPNKLSDYALDSTGFLQHSNAKSPKARRPRVPLGNAINDRAHSPLSNDLNQHLSFSSDEIAPCSPGSLAGFSDNLSSVSPTSSFGKSFMLNYEVPRRKRCSPTSSDVYTPELLKSLRIPPPQAPGPQPVAAVAGADKEAPTGSVSGPRSSTHCPRELPASEKPSCDPITPPCRRHKAHSTKNVPDNGVDGLSDLSSLTSPSAGIVISKATRAHNERLRRMLVPAKRVELPPLHLHMSEDGSSPLPPGWQRAPNPAASVEGGGAGYPYYYYHTRTRAVRWDPPVYPWDADPEDNLIPDRPDDDPEAPYNWNCASRYAVTHEEIAVMYAQFRSRMLERQCLELIHEMGGRPDVPQGAQEQNFAIELFAFIHNELRKFKDGRLDNGCITSEEDLHYLTNKLAQEVIPKEVRNLHRAQAASLFAAAPEVTPVIRERVANYVCRYMESKGSHYCRSRSHAHAGGGGHALATVNSAAAPAAAAVTNSASQQQRSQAH